MHDEDQELMNEWDLVIVIPSHITEFSRRCAVRDGWARQLRGHEQNNRGGLRSIKLLFTVGAHYPDNYTRDTAMAEMKQFDDIITLPADFKDYYRNLATKTRLSIHEVVHRTKSFKLLLKVDTDSYVHVDRLLDFMDSHKMWENNISVYAGAFETSNVVWNPRDKDDKWYDGEFADLTGMEKYPWHAKGAGYVLSYKLAKYLSDPPVPLRSWVHEDVGIGAWLMPVSWDRIDMPVRFMEPQCDCATLCTGTMFHRNEDDPEEKVVIDHYIPEYLHRWRQRRFELFGDECWIPRPTDVESPLVDIEPSAVETADYIPPVTMGYYETKYHFEPLRSRAKPPLIPSHADTRSGVCKMDFSFEDIHDAGSFSLRAIRSHRICRGSDGSIYDDFECDRQSEGTEQSSVVSDWKDRSSSSSSCDAEAPIIVERTPLSLPQCLQLASINNQDSRGWATWDAHSHVCKVLPPNACHLRPSLQKDASLRVFEHVSSTASSLHLEPRLHQYGLTSNSVIVGYRYHLILFFVFIIPLAFWVLFRNKRCLPLVGRLRRNRRRRHSGAGSSTSPVE